jgi:hypothetical protein
MSAAAPRVTTLEPGQDGEYRAFVDGHAESSAYHTLEWRDLLSAVYGYRAHYLVARSAEQVCGVLPLMMVESPLAGRHLSALPFSHRVPLLATAAAREALLLAAQELARACSARHIELREDSARLDAPGFVAGARYWQSVLDLTPPLETLQRQVRASTRRNVARATKAGVTVRAAGGDIDYLVFYRLVLETRRQQGTPPYPRRLFEALARVPWARLFLACDAQGTPLAGLCIFMHGGRALYAYGASSKRIEHLEQRPNDALFWHVIALLRGEQVSTLDFGVSPEHLGELRRYKENWGARSSTLQHARWSPHGAAPRAPARTGLVAGIASRLIRHTPTPILAWAGDRYFKYLG